jgi:flagellar basal body-associated protein FliL
MKTIQLLVILLVIAFIIVVVLVGSGMLFGKATAQVDLRKDMPVAEYYVLSNIPILFATMA